jgi:hypothetical protein
MLNFVDELPYLTDVLLTDTYSIVEEGKSIPVAIFALRVALLSLFRM